MKILNLYACLGGNRYKWNEVKKEIKVTAVEWDEELAKLYQKRFPNDTVILADAQTKEEIEYLGMMLTATMPNDVKRIDSICNRLQELKQ